MPKWLMLPLINASRRRRAYDKSVSAVTGCNRAVRD